MAGLPSASNPKLWGTQYNDYLLTGHKADGTHFDNIINVTDPAYGATGLGVADDTAAIKAAMLAAQASGSPVYFPAGTYLTDPITDFVTGMVVFGDGPRDTILQARLTNQDVITITGITFHTVTIKGLQIKGFGSGTGIGINIHTPLVSPPYNLFFSDIHILDCGAQGLYVDDEFSSRFSNIFVSGCGDNAIEVEGGNTTTLENCFVGLVATTKAAYRIYESPTMIACNGLTHPGGEVANVDWGVFGQTVAEDGVNSTSRPTLINCNVEDFTRYGCRFKTNSGGTFIGTSFTNTTGTAAIALYYDTWPQVENVPFWDGTSVIVDAGGGWTNSLPIHARGVPFIVLGTNQWTDSFYDHLNAVEVSLPTISWALKGTQKEALAISHLYAPSVIGGAPTAITTGDATPSVLGGNTFLSVGVTNITDFDDGVVGQSITFIAETSITVEDGTNIFLSGSANFVMTATDTLTLIQKADGKWYETSRGDNGA